VRATSRPLEVANRRLQAFGKPPPGTLKAGSGSLLRNPYLLERGGPSADARWAATVAKRTQLPIDRRITGTRLGRERGLWKSSLRIYPLALATRIARTWVPTESPVSVVGELQFHAGGLLSSAHVVTVAPCDVHPNVVAVADVTTGGC